MIPEEQLLLNLVNINSINPDLVAGGAGEAEIARFIAHWLEEAGLEVVLQEVKAGRPNVIGIARGSGGGKTLMLNGHIDTVGVAGMQPADARATLRDGKIFGRGAYDMKGGLAACMLAVAQAKSLNLRGDVIFTGVMDEEYAGLGTEAVVKQWSADGAIIAEPTDLQLIVAHRGFVWLEVETIGVAAHGSRPDLGVDAITKMGGVLTALEKLDLKLRAKPLHKYLKSGSVHASLIGGGQDWASYPERCVLSVERRTIPGESVKMVEAELQDIINELAKNDPAFKAVIRRGMVRPPMETPEQAAVISQTSAAAEAVLGRKVERVGVAYWTDAATLWAAGIPSILLGPLGAGAHAAEEWVDVKSVLDCVQIFTKTMSSFCA
ncbi:MAG: ArgE/DapE family deacylase [Anaerolineae bacterium]|nr:ArgE/DapE family deacylase [Anaerolineae bacterium]